MIPFDRFAGWIPNDIRKTTLANLKTSLSNLLSTYCQTWKRLRDLLLMLQWFDIENSQLTLFLHLCCVWHLSMEKLWQKMVNTLHVMNNLCAKLSHILFLSQLYVFSILHIVHSLLYCGYTFYCVLLHSMGMLDILVNRNNGKKYRNFILILLICWLFLEIILVNICHTLIGLINN